jgi:hypothetical protein
MYPLLKDNNGDRYSILNGNIKGIFFSALLFPSTLWRTRLRKNDREIVSDAVVTVEIGKIHVRVVV